MHQPENGSRPTSHDVARLAGLSRSTVSQVLNGHDGFPEKTRRRVREAADALDYRPSRAGRALKSGMDDLVLVLLQNITYGHDMQDTLDRIAAAGDDVGLATLVRSGGVGRAGSADALRDMRPRLIVDFGVLAPDRRARLRAAGTRVLAVSDEPAGTLDEFDLRIGRVQAEELLRKGKRRLIYATLGDERPDLLSPGRAAGVDTVLAERGLPPAIRARVPLDPAGAIEALAPRLHDEDAVGIACYNDDVAIAALAVARHLARTVPESIAVVGVDNSRLAQLVFPRLTTIDVTLDAVVERLARAIADESFVASPIDWTAALRLIPGEST